MFYAGVIDKRCLLTIFISSACVGDGIHEKDINVQNAKMSGLNPQKEKKKMWGLSAIRSFGVCFVFFFFFVVFFF